MDEIVTRAMAKWPNVPAVYGWLSLDARGQWLIKGETIGNPGITKFIGRNYDRDSRGRWFFQNGPQRVFVTLACTPFVYRVDTGGSGELIIATHTGRLAETLDGCWVDEQGRLIAVTDVGLGMVHDRDAESIANRLTDESGRSPTDDELLTAIESLQAGHSSNLYLPWRGCRIPIEPTRSEDLLRRFEVDRFPQPDADEEACT